VARKTRHLSVADAPPCGQSSILPDRLEDQAVQSWPQSGKARRLHPRRFAGSSQDMLPDSLIRALLLPLLAVSMAAIACLPARGASGDQSLGAYLAGECVACHLPSGRQVGGIPAIVGWPQSAFIAVMQAVAAKFTADELAALAAYFGSLKPP
jgi:cytochrome c553